MTVKVTEACQCDGACEPAVTTVKVARWIKPSNANLILKNSDLSSRTSSAKKEAISKDGFSVNESVG